jgi:hypothetical protein
MGNAPLWILDDGRTMGGGQRFALRLLRFVRAAGRESVLVAPADSAVAREAASHGIRVAGAEFPDPSRPIAVAHAAVALRRVVRDAPADALIVGGSARCQLVAVFARVRIVCLMHEQDSAARRFARLLRFAGPMVAMGANAQAAYAHATGRPVARIDNILEPGELEAMIAGRLVARDGQQPALGVVGRLIPEKGIQQLVRELASVPDDWATLRVAAPREDGAYADATQRLIEELGLQERIALLGETSDVAGFLADVDVLVVPSIGREGQPTVILEALACGRPVVVRRAIMSRDYEGLPVFPYDGHDLAAALSIARSVPAVAPEVLRARFTPQAALATLETAAAS